MPMSCFDEALQSTKSIRAGRTFKERLRFNIKVAIIKFKNFKNKKLHIQKEIYNTYQTHFFRFVGLLSKLHFFGIENKRIESN